MAIRTNSCTRPASLNGLVTLEVFFATVLGLLVLSYFGCRTFRFSYFFAASKRGIEFIITNDE